MSPTDVNPVIGIAFIQKTVSISIRREELEFASLYIK